MLTQAIHTSPGEREPTRTSGPVERATSDRSHLLAHIGNTPLIRIRAVEGIPDRVGIFAKAEWFNPGGSVKDRPVLNMLLTAERQGILDPSKTLIDATSGNTGIAYAMIARAIGRRVALAMPENASPDRKRILEAFGAHVVYTDPFAGTDGAQHEVRELVRRFPDRYISLDQYNNEANWRAHYAGTAEELWSQSLGAVTHFVAGLGTTGTFVGVSRRLKERNAAVRCVSVGPDSPLHGIEGLKHLPTAITPGIYDRALVDEHVEVATEQAYEVTRRLARDQGLFVGVSGGAAVAACFRIARQLEAGTIVTVLPDGGAKYAGERFWRAESGSGAPGVGI